MNTEADRKLLRTLNHLEVEYADKVLQEMTKKNLEYLYVNYLDSRKNYPKAINYLSNELDRRAKAKIEETNL